MICTQSVSHQARYHVSCSGFLHEKNKTLKFVSELAEAGGSAAQKASAKIASLPEVKQSNLNIYITAPGGETNPVGGVTIVQEEIEEVVVEEIKKPEKTDE